MYHDAAEPLGWLLESVHTGERLVFLTDTSLSLIHIYKELEAQLKAEREAREKAAAEAEQFREDSEPVSYTHLIDMADMFSFT